MRTKRAIVAGAAVLAITGATWGGVALASSTGSDSKAQPSAAVSSEPEAADTDNVLEGDQTGPDEADANEAADTETEGAESDGPGGHEDPPGNVDHEFDGEE